jgi:hypothetical protein
MSDQARGAREAANPAGPARMHGLANGERGAVVRFAIALWPYDLLLRFGYDLPENEHLWPGEWFDDRFEEAALDMRSTAAKLVLALAEMRRAGESLRVASPDERRDAIASLREAVERAPLTVDLVVAYLRRLQDALAGIIPCCFGKEGHVLAGSRGSLAALVATRGLESLDQDLARLLREAPDLAIRANRPDLYVIGENAAFAAALPRAAARALTAAAAETLAAMERAEQSVATHCRWFDALLARLQAAVAERAEDGPGLLERWSEGDWAVLMAAPGEGLAAALPEV